MLDIYVCSAGGCATTLLINFIQHNTDYYFVTNNIKDKDGLKHKAYPHKNICNKAIYLFGNPMNTAISLIGRWRSRASVKITGLQFPPNVISLEDFVRNGIDYYGFERQYHNWSTMYSGYPIMLVKYENMWDNLETIFSYIGIDKSKIKKFPKKRRRKSDWTEKPDHIRKDLLNMYGKFYKNVYLKAKNVEILYYEGSD